MDAFVHFPDSKPDRAPYECCGCPRTATPIARCGCWCHESAREYEDCEYDPSCDGYVFATIDTGWPLGERQIWVRPLRWEWRTRTVIVEAMTGCPFTNGLEGEGRHVFRHDLLWSSRARVSVRALAPGVQIFRSDKDEDSPM